MSTSRGSRRSRRERREQEPDYYAHSIFANSLRTIFAGFLILLVLSGLGYYFHGKIGVEKTLTCFAYPVGASWLLLASWTLQFLLALRIKSALFPLLFLTALTCCTVSPIVDFVVRYLEDQVEPFDPQTAEQLDVIVVLGGGTKEGPNRAEAASSGDRVLYAAQLFHLGITDRLITTGTAIGGIGGSTQRSPSEQTIEIWSALGIPIEKIGTLEGRNTFEEIRSLSDLIKEEKLSRIGVLTSATHLPRAMRLAKEAGLPEFTPIAADHDYDAGPKRFADYLPNYKALSDFTGSYHEILAGLVDR